MQRSLTRDKLADVFSSGGQQDERVGIEVESGLVDRATGCSVPYEGDHGAKALLDAIVREWNGKALLVDKNIIGVELPNGANFTLETGGALEYASAPLIGLVQAVSIARADLLRVAAIAQGIGIALLSGACLPFTPKDKIPWIPKPRVKIMRDYFSRLGESGMYADEVMGLTLSTQTSLDYLSHEDLVEKMRLHVLAAPIVAALFVNSPIAEGGYSGVMSRRMQYWRKFDPRRCGVLGFALNENASVYDLVDWAIKLPMIYRKVDDGTDDGTHIAAPDRSFADLMRYGFGDGTWPSQEDFVLHLSQLWPHVRPRRWLELRASDGLPWPYFSAAPAIWVGLSYDMEIRKKAIAYLSDLTALQLESSIDDIAVKGLQASVGLGEVVQDRARGLLQLARLGLEKRVEANLDPEQVLSYLEPLEQVGDSGYTFADKCAISWKGELGKSPEAYVEKYRIPFDTSKLSRSLGTGSLAARNWPPWTNTRSAAGPPSTRRDHLGPALPTHSWSCWPPPRLTTRTQTMTN
jgi:glutamate--cysteine ligase